MVASGQRLLFVCVCVFFCFFLGGGLFKLFLVYLDNYNYYNYDY